MFVRNGSNEHVSILLSLEQTRLQVCRMREMMKERDKDRPCNGPLIELQAGDGERMFV